MADEKKRQTLLAVMKEIDKKHGAGTIKFASEVKFAHRIRISTGIFNLDKDLGGGVPKGRIGGLVGDESGGKSTICLKIAAAFQHTCRACNVPFKWYTKETLDKQGEVKKREMIVVEPCPCGENKPHMVAYIDAEGTFEETWAVKNGIDLSTLLLIQPEWAEQGVDAIVAMMRTGELDLVVVDSVAEMTPGVEIEKSAEELTVGSLARIMNRAMRVFQSALNSLGMDYQNKPTVLLVNQFREKVGVSHGDPRTWPGGRGQNYAMSWLLILSGGKVIDSKGIPGGTDEDKVGMALRYHVKKNKVGAPEGRGIFKLFNVDAPHLGYMKGDVDNFDQMVEYLEHVGAFTKAGAWIDLAPRFGEEFKNPDSKNGMFQGKAKLIEWLKSDPAKTALIRDFAIQTAKEGGIPFVEDDENEADEDGVVEDE